MPPLPPPPPPRRSLPNFATPLADDRDVVEAVLRTLLRSGAPVATWLAARGVSRLWHDAVAYERVAHVEEVEEEDLDEEEVGDEEVGHAAAGEGGGGGGGGDDGDDGAAVAAATLHYVFARRVLVRVSPGCGRPLRSLEVAGGGLEVVGAHAFAPCAALRHVSLARCAALRYIGDDAFAECPLTSLDLSGCVALRHVGARAFHDVRLTCLDVSACASLRCHSFLHDSFETLRT